MTTTRERLVAFYRQHNPIKLNDVDVILQTFADRQDEMMQALYTKYNVKDNNKKDGTAQQTKEDDSLSVNKQQVNQNTEGIFTKSNIRNWNNASDNNKNADTHSKMAKLLESMSAIDLVLLQQRISTLLHSSFDEQTRHDVLWHTTRYLCYFLQCAQQFYALALQKQKQQLQQHLRQRQVLELKRICTSVQTEEAVHVQTATQTDDMMQTRQQKQKQHFAAEVQAYLQSKQQINLSKLTFDMAVNTSNTLNASPVSTALFYNNNNSSSSNGILPMRNDQPEQVNIDSNKQNKQSSANRSIDATRNKESYTNSYNNGSKKARSVLLRPRCVNTQHTTKHESDMTINKAQAIQSTPTNQLKTITLTFCPPSQEKDSVISGKLQQILPLSCNITLILNPGTYYQNLQFIAQVVAQRQIHQCKNFENITNTINNSDRITIIITSAFPGAMVVIKPCQTCAPALTIRGSVNVIIRSVMFVGYDSMVNSTAYHRQTPFSKVNKSVAAPLIYVGNGPHVLMQGCHVYSSNGGGIVMKCDINYTNQNNCSELNYHTSMNSTFTSSLPLLTKLQCRLCLFTKCGFAGLFVMGNGSRSSSSIHSMCSVKCTHCQFTFCEVGLHIHNASCTLHKCLVQHCIHDGMVINGSGSYNKLYAPLHSSPKRTTHKKTPECTLTQCVIAHNANNGVLIGLSAQVQVTKCVIEENACYGIERFTGCTLHLDRCVIRNNGIAPISTSFDEIEQSYQSLSTCTSSSNNSYSSCSIEQQNQLVHLTKTLDYIQSRVK